MASLWRKFNSIKLLGAVHYLTDFDSNAFPHVLLPSEPKNPLQGLTENSSIVKVKI